MTSHKHSFQCFDAVVEKPALTAGHNFALPHTSSCTPTHLDQLENHRCSLCSESQQAKPVTSEVSGNQSVAWYQSQSPSHQHTPRKPMRPERDPVYGVAHHHRNHHHQNHTHRHRKRIVLVKNSNPSIQKTILLHRKPVHSFGVFMDDVSELMHCFIRKLYTLDGHKVDSVPSLLQGPSVLVCVGREPFHPLLLDSFQKRSEDKLPKLILKSQSSTCNEDQGYKKNVNFGLKSKKSIPPGPSPKARENMLDDDIEKRVLINKDGSLSMEMKVRFRLLNDETLHYSTEIKKSSCTFNVSFPGQDNVHYPHCGLGESCSEAESLSASEAEDVYISKLCQKHLKEPHCQHCHTHCQEYDIWKNPALSEQETLRHIGSNSLNAASHKIKCKRESFDSAHTTSCEEYTEQVVEKATCIQHIGDKGDNTVQYCTISRCSSRSEVCSVSSKAKRAGYTDEKDGKNESAHAFAVEQKTPISSKNFNQDPMSFQVSTEDERPLSVETNSSDILASLKEDDDIQESDLSPSNFRAPQDNKENDKQPQNAVVSPYLFTPCKPPESPNYSLSTRTSSIASGCSVKSKSSRKLVVKETQENLDQDKNNTPSSTPHRCQNKEWTDVAIENGTSEEKLEAIKQSEDVVDANDVPETDIRALKSESDLSKTPDDILKETVETCQRDEKERSSVRSTEQEPVNVKEPIVGYASEEENIKVSGQDLDTSESPEDSDKTEEPVDVTHEEKVTSVMSPKSNVSARSSRSRLSELECIERKKAELQKEERPQSIMSVHSNASTISIQSTVSELLVNGTEDETEEVMPRALSNVSRSSQISDLETSELREIEEQVEDRSPSIMSVKSSSSEVSPVKLVKVLSAESITSTLSTKTNISVRSATSKISEGTPANMDNTLLTERVPSAMSVKSDVSVRSKTSNILDISPQKSEVVGEARENRAPSAKSNKSNTSSRSNTPKISTAALKEADILEEERLKRPLSVMSSKSNASVSSTKSKLRDDRDDNIAEKAEQLQDKCITSGIPRDSELSKKSKTSEATLDKSGDFADNSEEQAPSTMSTKLNTPRKLKKSKMLESGMVEEERPLSASSSKSSISKKSGKCKISEAAQECDHPEERPASIMSSTSVKSKKSVVSDAQCENAEEETKQTGRRSQNALSVRSHRSRKSKASEASRQDIGDEDNRERTPSAMSCKSNLSDCSNLAPDGLDNTGATKDLLKEHESSYKETKEDRAASALSSKTQMSSLSNKSKDLFPERAPTSMSAKSNVSTKSTNSKKDERAFILALPNSNTSAINSDKSESLAVVSPAEVEHQSTERALSASVSSRSVKSNVSASVGGQTVCLNERSNSALSGSTTSMTEISNNADNEVRASSALSKKSNRSSVHHMSERVLTPASASVSIGIVGEYDVDNAEEDDSVSLVSVNSTPQLNSKTDVCCKESLKTIENENQQRRQTPDDRAKSSLTERTIVSDKSKKSECTHKNSSQPVTDNEVANNTSAKKSSKKSSSRSLSSRSAHSDLRLSKTKDIYSPELTDRPKSNMSNTLLQLEVNGQKSDANVQCKSVGERSKSNLSCHRNSKKELEISRPHSADVPMSSVLRQKSKEPVSSLGVSNHRSSPSNKNANKSNTTRDLNICGRTFNGSLVATDCSRNVNDYKSEKNSNSSYRHSSSSLAQTVDNNTSELVPSILPSSSPTEVVNEWLKKIPLDCALYAVGDEFHEHCEEGELLKISVTQYEKGNGCEGDADEAVLKPENKQLQVEEIQSNKSKLGDMKETAKDLTVVENFQPSTFPDVPSSVQVMKILLSPKLERCNSLPEVSPVYGRKLSMSAIGLLDSLVNLELLDFDHNDLNGKTEKYNNLMNMLQSLWLCDPPDSKTITQKSKCNNQHSNDEEFNVESSSGVDINNSFKYSGKSSVNESTLALKSQTNTEGEGIEILTKVQETDETEKALKGTETQSDSATPDIASRVRWTPENEAEENMQESNVLTAFSDFTIGNDYSPKEPSETASISNKSSVNDGNVNQNLTDHEEDTRSESPSSQKMAHSAEKVSEDPDPVWVLNLLNKIKKQFMTHYVTAMVEFKVRWNLNDNEHLDVMICELRDEVHKRIQASINNELRKIQGPVGTPRPPKESMSRESSILTEQRRRRLKVNLNHSTDLAAKTDNNDENAAILKAEFTDQQNDDEYCPCDTCMKKKITSRPVFATKVSNSAPLMIDFDLRKILHLKRNVSSNSSDNVKKIENEDGNLAEDILLESFKEEKTQSKSIEQKQIESDTLSDKAKITDEAVEEVSDKMAEGKGSVEGETVSEEHAIEAGTAKENMSVEAGTVEQELAERESTDGKETEVEISENETEDETAEDKTLAKTETMGEKTSENSQVAEEEISESEPEEEGEIPNDEKEEHEDAKTATTQKNIPEKPDIVVKAESSKGEDKTDEEDDTAESEKSKSTDNEESDGNESAEEVVAVEEISKESGEDYLVDEEKISEPSKDRASTEHETAQEANPMNDESAKEGETDNDELDVEDQTTKAETSADEEKADSETAEYREKFYDDTSDRTEMIKVKSAEDGETNNSVTTEDRETAEVVDAGEVSEATVAEDDDYESAEDAETSKAQTAGDTSDNETAENGKTPQAEIAEDGEIFDNGISNDDGVNDAHNAERAEDKDTDNYELSLKKLEETEHEEMHGDGTSDDREAAGTVVAEDEEIPEATEEKVNNDDDDDDDDDDERAEEPKRAEEIIDKEIVEDGDKKNIENLQKNEGRQTETAEDTEMDTSQSEEDGETADDGTAEDEENLNDNTANDETAEDEEKPNDNAADDGTAEDEENPNDNTANDGTAEDEENPNDNTANDGTAEDEENPNDNTADVETAEDEEKPNDNTANGETAEDEENPNDNAANDGTAEDEVKPNDNAANDGTAEEKENPYDNAADDGTAEESDIEEVDETTGAETAEDGEQEHNDKLTTGTENEENEETAEAKTGEDGETADNETTEDGETADNETTEDGETADNETTEDGDTADEREADDYELSKHEKAQNGEIVKGKIEDYSQTDGSESLENGETAGEVNEKTHKSNPAETVINTHNIKTKPNTEMLSVNVSTPSVNTGESDEGGDEAEDEREPIETDGRAYGIKIPATQPTEWWPHKADIKMNFTVKVYPSSEDGADADGEDSETEVHNMDGSVENEEEG